MDHQLKDRKNQWFEQEIWNRKVELSWHQLKKRKDLNEKDILSNQIARLYRLTLHYYNTIQKQTS